MSNHVISLLRRKKLGVGFTAKSLILLMADMASDDGSGIWASKARMARELETTDRTVQRTIDALIEAGFLVEVGRKKHRNGFTFEYAIRIKMVEKCDDSTPQPPDRASPVNTRCRPPDTRYDPRHSVTPDRVSPHPRHTVTPWGDTVSPKPNRNPNRTPPPTPRWGAKEGISIWSFG